MKMPEERRPSSFSPKKKRTFQAANKKHLILKVANEVFAEKGYGETTISQIAKKANIAEGSIYDYFKNKEDLLFSIPEERMENYLSGLRAHLKGIKGALPKLRKLIWYQLDFYEKNQDYTRILLLDLRQNPRFNRSRAYRMIRQYSKIILEVIEEGKKEDEIRKEVDPYLLRDLLLGTVEHFSIRGFIMGRFPNLAAASDDLYELVISGVENKKQMITLPLEELRKFRHPGMAQPIPHKGRISAG
jgi:TetR/AcrR family fatty acid metabolism transcriptional regulator